MKLNKEKGTISDISLIKIGGTMDGRVVTSETISDTLRELKNPIPVYLAHTNDNENIASRNPADAIGFVSGAYTDEEGVKGHLQLLKAFMANRKGEYDTLFERAEIDPSGFGISFSFFGDTNKKGEIRFSSIVSADLVEMPAANEQGLLSVQEIKEENSVASEANGVAIKEMINEQPVVEQKLSNEETTTSIINLERPIMKKETYEKIKKDYPDQLLHAMKLSIEDGMMDDAIIESIESALEDAKIAALVSERDALQAKVAELTLTVADLQAKLVELEKGKTEAVSTAEQLSLKLSKMGVSPINMGDKLSVSTKNLKEQMEELPTFSDRLSFYRKHQKEIDELS